MIWGRFSKQNTLRILKLQKRTARIILKADITTPSKTLFSELNWLTFPQRVQYHTCTMVYKALNGLAPEYILVMYLPKYQNHICEIYDRSTMICFEFLVQELVTMKIRSQYHRLSYGMNSRLTFVAFLL